MESVDAVAKSTNESPIGFSGSIIVLSDLARRISLGATDVVELRER
jgi:hypothetical protein